MPCERKLYRSLLYRYHQSSLLSFCIWFTVWINRSSLTLLFTVCCSVTPLITTFSYLFQEIQPPQISRQYIFIYCPWSYFSANSFNFNYLPLPFLYLIIILHMHYICINLVVLCCDQKTYGSGKWS